MTRDLLLKEALTLPASERAEVAAEILASLDEGPGEDPEEVAKAWAVEIDRRARRALDGETTGRPWDEVRQRLAERIATR